MRYDINMLWVDDTPKWYSETKEIMEMDIEDQNLTADIHYISNCKELLNKIEQEQDGFKVYDMFFIDYSLSDEITGSNVIKMLRNININSDILFYSSEKENIIREEIKEDLSSYEGVYVANRENFRDQSLKLIKKNAKRLMSLSNIRGVLMDQTSENDYIILSYILKKFDQLGQEQKGEINNMVLTYMVSKQPSQVSISQKEIEKVRKSGISNIKKFLDLPSYLVPLDLKYKIFQMIIEFNNEGVFSDYTIENYFGDIVKKRNNVAHKKMDICRMQKNILYYDNINEYYKRQCPDNCDQHFDDNKISIPQWMDIRKQLISYGKCFDAIITDMMSNVDVEEEVAASIEQF